MNLADEQAAKLVPTESADAAAGSIDKLDEQLRVSVEALLHPSSPQKPVVEVDDLLSAITHHLDEEASERKAIRHCLLATQDEMERLASRGFRYLVAICIGVAAILAWQSYAETAKQVIATSAPELGWTPGTKQMIASWMQQLGWTKPLAVGSKAAAVTQTAPETVAPKPPAAPALDPQRIQQMEADIAAVRQAIERHLAGVRETVGQLAANQDQIAREIEKLQATNMEILAKIPVPPPQPLAAPAHKPTPVHPARKLAPTPFWRRLAPHP
jgi:hypothetical protein